MTYRRFSGLTPKTHWGLLLFAVFIVYLFAEPLRRGPSPLEWTLTALGVSGR